MRKLLAIVKALLCVVIGGAVLIASFYLAYLLLVLLVMIGLGLIAYAFFMWNDIKDWFDYD